MAKYRHRIFEMYEFHDETITALTPKSVNPVATDDEPNSWSFEHLAVSRSGSVTYVRFKEEQADREETATNFGGDLSRLADRLSRNSRVLLDFAGVTSFSAASINAVAQFQEKLKFKGSRVALCCLETAVRKSFFSG